MNTLLTLHQQPLHITNCSSWHQRSQPPPQPKTIKTPLYVSSSSAWKLHAEAKGFGGSTTSNNTRQENTKDAPKVSKEDDEDDRIPQIVFNRMIRRMLGYVGVPLAVGVVLLQLFGLLKENHLWDVPLWVPFVTTFLTFGSSVLGVAYGPLSTSWDPESEGSLLGLQEAKQNWVEMWKEENQQN